MLAGKVIDVSSPQGRFMEGAARLDGRRCTAIDAYGKHLLYRFDDLSLHIHHAIRDDAWLLYGFGERHERDLFRELVAVTGVGPQMGLGLLGAMEPGELVQAIVQADLRRLCQAPGVGKRTAERLAVELRTRLQQRFLG